MDSADLSGLLDADSVPDVDEEEQSYSATQVLEKLEKAWLNEKMCPELLEHHMEFVDVMLEQLKELETMIGHTPAKTDLRVSVHLMEIDRIKFVISDYLRCRVKKIEEFAQFIISDPVEQLKLSESELKFASGYWSSIKTHLDESAAKNMPENIRTVNTSNMVVKPDYYKYVFIRATRPITGVSVSESASAEEELIDLDTHDQQLVPYKSIDNLLSNSSVYLI